MHMGPGNMAPIRITFHTLIRYWLVSPWSCTVAAALLLAAFWYFQATRDIADRGEWWPASRLAAFLAGLVALELAFQSSIALLPYISFPVAAVQHLLLIAVAPALLVLGAPVSLALETSSPTVEAKLHAALESRGLRALLHPAITFLLFCLALFGFFLSSVFYDAMRNVWLLDLCHVGIVAIGVAFWGPLLGRDPWPYWDLSPGLKGLSVVVGIPVVAAFGLDLMSRSTPVAPIYTLHDSRAGGAVLLVALEVALVAAGVGIFRLWRGVPDDEPVAIGHPVEQIT